MGVREAPLPCSPESPVWAQMGKGVGCPGQVTPVSKLQFPHLKNKWQPWMVAKITGAKTQAVLRAGPDYRVHAGKAASNYAEDAPHPQPAPVLRLKAQTLKPHPHLAKDSINQGGCPSR